MTHSRYVYDMTHVYADGRVGAADSEHESLMCDMTR